MKLGVRMLGVAMKLLQKHGNSDKNAPSLAAEPPTATQHAANIASSAPVQPVYLPPALHTSPMQLLQNTPGPPIPPQTRSQVTPQRPQPCAQTQAIHSAPETTAAPFPSTSHPAQQPNAHGLPLLHHVNHTCIQFQHPAPLPTGPPAMLTAPAFASSPYPEPSSTPSTSQSAAAACGSGSRMHAGHAAWIGSRSGEHVAPIGMTPHMNPLPTAPGGDPPPARTQAGLMPLRSTVA